MFMLLRAALYFTGLKKKVNIAACISFKNRFIFQALNYVVLLEMLKTVLQRSTSFRHLL